MSAGQSGATSPGAAAGGGGGGAAEAAPVHHPRSFKLRFAAQREPGRSYVSLVKPLGLPATVTGKFYARAQPADGDEEGSLRSIRDMFERGPRERLASPLTSAHEYGWWAADAAATAAAAARGDRRLAHHVRDSAWLKARLLVLAEDARLGRR